MDEPAKDSATRVDVSGAADNWPLSAREAAAVIGVSERTVRRAIARGELPATMYAGTYRIAPDALAFFRRRLTTPTRLRQPSQRSTDAGLPHVLPPGRIPVPSLPLPLTPL